MTIFIISAFSFSSLSLEASLLLLLLLRKAGGVSFSFFHRDRNLQELCLAHLAERTIWMMLMEYIFSWGWANWSSFSCAFWAVASHRFPEFPWDLYKKRCTLRLLLHWSREVKIDPILFFPFLDILLAFLCLTPSNNFPVKILICFNEVISLYIASIAANWVRLLYIS